MPTSPVVEVLPLSTGLRYELLSWAPADPSCEHTLLLLHGFLDLAWGWTPVVDTGLLSRFHVLAPSFRGHGRSDWIGPGGSYYFLDYVADIASLVALRARARLSIVGHSMGGTVAGYFAGSFPDRVAKLALLEGLSAPEYATGPQRMRDAITGRERALAKRGTQAEPGGRRFASLAEASARMQHHDPRLDAALAQHLAEQGCVQLPDGSWTFRHDPLLVPRTPVGFELSIAQRFWSEVRCDLLYVDGDASPVRLGGEERARRLGAFSEVRSRTEIEIPGAGHMMLRHAAVETAQHLAAFLGAQP